LNACRAPDARPRRIQTPSESDLIGGNLSWAGGHRRNQVRNPNWKQEPPSPEYRERRRGGSEKAGEDLLKGSGRGKESTSRGRLLLSHRQTRREAEGYSTNKAVCFTARPQKVREARQKKKEGRTTVNKEGRKHKG